MANQILNSGLLSLTNRGPAGGFRHWSGLWVAGRRSGDAQHASVRNFHVPVGNASAIFRGDIIAYLATSAALNAAAGGDMYYNEFQYGGAPVGDPAIAGDVANVIAAGDTTHVILGVCVGWELTLAAAKTGQPYIPAGVEAWLHVDTDPDIEMLITGGGSALPANGWGGSIGAGVDLLARNATYQSLKFGISGQAIDPTTIGVTATLPLVILGAEAGIGNDVTDAPVISGASTIGNPVIRCGFNKSRHAFGGGANLVL